MVTRLLRPTHALRRSPNCWSTRQDSHLHLLVFTQLRELLRYGWWLRRKESNLRIPVSETGVCTDTNYSASKQPKLLDVTQKGQMENVAPRPGLEPGIVALTVRYSTVELPRIGLARKNTVAGCRHSSPPRWLYATRRFGSAVGWLVEAEGAWIITTEAHPLIVGCFDLLELLFHRRAPAVVGRSFPVVRIIAR